MLSKSVIGIKETPIMEIANFGRAYSKETGKEVLAAWFGEGNKPTKNIIYNETIKSLNNGNTFWLINDDRISKKSNILAIRNINTDIEIFLTNGDVLTIYNKELIAVNNLNVGKVKKISFERHNIIVNSESGKTIIF